MADFKAFIAVVVSLRWDPKCCRPVWYPTGPAALTALATASDSRLHAAVLCIAAGVPAAERRAGRR